VLIRLLSAEGKVVLAGYFKNGSWLHASRVLFTLHLFLSFSDGPTDLKIYIQFGAHYFKRKGALKIFEVLSQ
jgi:hypothetical protein